MDDKQKKFICVELVCDLIELIIGSVVNKTFFAPFLSYPVLSRTLLIV